MPDPEREDYSGEGRIGDECRYCAIASKPFRYQYVLVPVSIFQTYPKMESL
jgi:hypothetical protein